MGHTVPELRDEAPISEAKTSNTSSVFSVGSLTNKGVNAKVPCDFGGLLYVSICVIFSMVLLVGRHIIIQKPPLK